MALLTSRQTVFTVERDVVVSRPCPCGASLRARVVSAGEAPLESPHWNDVQGTLVYLDAAAMEAKALADAETNALENARELLDLVPCPRCALRPGRPKLHRRMAFAVLPPLLGSSLLGAVFGWVLALDKNLAWLGLLLAGACFLGGAVLAALAGRVAWRRFGEPSRHLTLLTEPYR